MRIKKLFDGPELPRESTVDKPFAWIVCLLVFMTNVILFGPNYAYPLLFPEIKDDLEITDSDLAWLYPITLLNTLIFAPLFNEIINRLGMRLSQTLAVLLWSLAMFASLLINNLATLILFIGIIPGFVAGIQYVATTMAMVRYFDKNFVLALSLSSCGIGCGSFIMPPVVGLLASYNSWRIVLFTLGTMQLQSLVTAASLRNLAPKKSVELDKNDSQKEENFFQRLCFNLPTLSLNFGTIFHLTCISIVATFLIPLARLQGIDQSGCIQIGLCMGLGNCLGRIVFGLILRKWPVFSGTSVLWTSSLCTSLMSFCLPISASNLNLMSAFAFIYGVALFSPVGLTAVFSGEMVRSDQSMKAFSLNVLAEGVGCFAAAPISTILIHLDESFFACFYYSGAALFVAVLFFSLPLYTVHFAKNKK
ncbi:hypothetical protein Ciccas_003251 [Cichlidogyrus casuarinus]|uniref:Major facilitator superfamily (MFS) profile domain-containing protein n=1 Tax=Cichlidogyrus casuarinus TaxID=1844966 RepID=A0ABD2QI66_9PLAT